MLERPTTSPLVSIIVPCYNHASYVGQCLESALAQTYPHTEIIVVNDGSTDNSLNVIDEFRRVYPDKIQVIDQPNAGLAKARDAAIQLARGEYILPLDADDYLRPRGVEHLVNYALEHPEFVVIYGNYERVTPQGEVFMDCNIRQSRPAELNLEGNILIAAVYIGIATAVSLIRRDKILEVGGYYSELTPGKTRSCEDFFLYLRLLLKGYEFGYVPEYIFYYRDTPNSMSKRQDEFESNHIMSLAYAFEHYPDRMAEAVFRARQLHKLDKERLEARIQTLASSVAQLTQERDAALAKLAEVESLLQKSLASASHTERGTADRSRLAPVAKSLASAVHKLKNLAR